MTEVKNANQSAQEKFYSGGDDVENLNNHNNWKTDFKVMAGHVIELAQGVWDKIVQLLTGKAPEAEPQIPEPQVQEQQVQEPPAEQPEIKPKQPDKEPAATPSVVKSENSLVTGPSGGVNPENDAIVENGTTFQPEISPIKVDNDVSVKPAPQGPLTPEQLEEFLANDTTYQEYEAELTRMDNRMTEIETKYGMPRIRDPFKDTPKVGSDEFSAQFKISGKQEDGEYRNLGLSYRFLKDMLDKYKTEMQNWTDGPCGENSFFQRTTGSDRTRYTHLERITLKDGRRAWKTDQGIFLPAPDGMPGGKQIDE